jgi:hypothetical protein
VGASGDCWRNRAAPGCWHRVNISSFTSRAGRGRVLARYNLAAASAPSVQWLLRVRRCTLAAWGKACSGRVLLLAVRRGHGRLAKPTAAVRPGAAPRTQEAGRSAGRQGGQRRPLTPDLLQDRGVAPALSQRGLRAWRRSRRSGRRDRYGLEPLLRGRDRKRGKRTRR